MSTNNPNITTAQLIRSVRDYLLESRQQGPGALVRFVRKLTEVFFVTIATAVAIFAVIVLYGAVFVGVLVMLSMIGSAF